MPLPSLLHKTLYRLGYSHRYGKLRPVYKPVKKDFYAGKFLLQNEAANELIKRKVLAQDPFLVARLGSVELSVIYNYLLYNKQSVVWDKQVAFEAQNNAGFFPVTDESLVAFAEKYLQCLEEVDIMGVWYNEGEEEVCAAYSPQAELIRLDAIEPYYHKSPWSAVLKGKTVLVVHPFEASIRHQYHHNRQYLFADPDVLPDFELKTLKAVQSIAGNQTAFSSWFEGLESMCEQISHTSFDVAIIGAGAYGLPLGAFVKKLGKQAIHMGGATQVLFGIKGKRWEDWPPVARLFNPYWKKPNPEETPKNAEVVENACYW